MHFRTSNSSYLDGRLQRRMLMYVGIAAVALFVIQWMQTASSRRPNNAAAPGPASVAGQPLDFSVRREAPLREGEFRSPIEHDRAVNPARTPGQAPLAGDEIDPLLPPELLVGIEDNTLGVTGEEAGAFFAVLDHARRVPATFLDQAARKDVLYINLMTEPEALRGVPVTVIGEMWRLDEFPAKPNPFGFQKLYEAWVFTKDSETHPYRLVMSSIDPQLKLGDGQRQPIRFTGYFFKREGYASKGGLHVAPTLLGKRLSTYRSPNAPPQADGLVPLMLGIVVAFGLILTVTLLSFAWSDQQQRTRVGSLPAMPPNLQATMEALDQGSVHDMLRELEDRERSAEYEALRGTTAPLLPPGHKPPAEESATHSDWGHGDRDRHRSAFKSGSLGEDSHDPGDRDRSTDARGGRGLETPTPLPPTRAGSAPALPLPPPLPPADDR